MNVRRALSVLVACFFAYFAYRAVRDGSFHVLAHIRLSAFISAAVIIFIGNNVLGGLRWWALQGYRGSAGSAVRSLTESIFFATVLPAGSVGGDIYRGASTHAAAPVVADRVVGAAVTTGCAAVALPIFLHAPGWLAWAAAASVVLGAYLAWRVLPRIRVGSSRVRRGLAIFGDVVSRRERVGPAIILTVGYLFCNTLFLLSLATAVGTHLVFVAGIVGSPLVLAAGAIPNVHGLSFVQLTIAAVLYDAGASAAQATAAGAAHLLITYVFALIGGSLLLERRLGRSHPPLAAHGSEASR
jgi:hypothetical protein